MKIIGITGGIGTGKSTILHILEQEYNAYIVETDRLAHSLMLKGKNAYDQIVDIFGTDILDSNLEIDRSKLGPIVFEDADKLLSLNNIVHPAVKTYIKNDIQEKKACGDVELYIIEAALLIEDGYKSICDEIWGIQVEKEERIQRLLNGRGGTRGKWMQVIENQSSEEFYETNCDEIINNNGDTKKTKERIEELLKKKN